MRSLIVVDMVRSLENVGLAAVDQTVDTGGMHRIRFRVVFQLDLGQVLSRLTTNHLAVVLGVEHGEMAVAFESAAVSVVSHGATHVGAQGAVGHDVAVGPNPTWNRISHADGVARGAGIGIVECNRLVQGHLVDDADRLFGVWQGHAACRRRWRRIGVVDRDDRCPHGCCCGTTRFQKEPAAYFDVVHSVSSLLVNDEEAQQDMCH